MLVSYATVYPHIPVACYPLKSIHAEGLWHCQVLCGQSTALHARSSLLPRWLFTFNEDSDISV